MTHPTKAKAADRRKFINDTRARQENILLPDAIRNAGNVDKYLWKGSANAPLVQRIGAWLIGSSFLGIGLEFLISALKSPNWFPILFAVVLIPLGIKMILNGSKRQKHQIERPPEKR